MTDMNSGRSLILEAMFAQLMSKMDSQKEDNKRAQEKNERESGENRKRYEKTQEENRKMNKKLNENLNKKLDELKSDQRKGFEEIKREIRKIDISGKGVSGEIIPLREEVEINKTSSVINEAEAVAIDCCKYVEDNSTAEVRAEDFKTVESVDIKNDINKNVEVTAGEIIISNSSVDTRIRRPVNNEMLSEDGYNFNETAEAGGNYNDPSESELIPEARPNSCVRADTHIETLEEGEKSFLSIEIFLLEMRVLSHKISDIRRFISTSKNMVVTSGSKIMRNNFQVREIMTGWLIRRTIADLPYEIDVRDRQRLIEDLFDEISASEKFKTGLG